MDQLKNDWVTKEEVSSQKSCYHFLSKKSNSMRYHLQTQDLVKRLNKNIMSKNDI